MSYKTNIAEMNLIESTASQLSLAAMSAAVLLTTMHAQVEHIAHPVTLEGHAKQVGHALMKGIEHGESRSSEQLRRASEETRHDSATYGPPRRSHAVTGTV